MQAAIEAAARCLSAIVMTSMAFILGVVPLFIASGPVRPASAPSGHRRDAAA